MEERDKNVEFHVVAGGPMHVKGRFTLIEQDGKKTEIEEEAWFCRCGASKNKPFCDGSHKTYGMRY
jgi:CDGSH-type Zn-finger protein